MEKCQKICFFKWFTNKIERKILKITESERKLKKGLYSFFQFDLPTTSCVIVDCLRSKKWSMNRGSSSMFCLCCSTGIISGTLIWQESKTWFCVEDFFGKLFMNCGLASTFSFRYEFHLFFTQLSLLPLRSDEIKLHFVPNSLTFCTTMLSSSGVHGPNWFFGFI